MSDNKLRSQDWFGRTGKDGFIYRAWMKNQGIPDEEFRGKPVIGICNTWSELTPCNAHFRELAESVKKGVIAAGGFPLAPLRLRQDHSFAGDGGRQREHPHHRGLRRTHADRQV
jgi:dihydroxyacid dehydratase/phosphogluconate dehydratase